MAAALADLKAIALGIFWLLLGRENHCSLLAARSQVLGQLVVDMGYFQAGGRNFQDFRNFDFTSRVAPENLPALLLQENRLIKNEAAAAVAQVHRPLNDHLIVLGRVAAGQLAAFGPHRFSHPVAVFWIEKPLAVPFLGQKLEADRVLLPRYQLLGYGFKIVDLAVALDRNQPQFRGHGPGPVQLLDGRQGSSLRDYFGLGQFVCLAALIFAFGQAKGTHGHNCQHDRQ